MHTRSRTSVTRDSVEPELESPPVHSSTPCEQLEQSSEDLLEKEDHSIPARNIEQSTRTQSVDQSSTASNGTSRSRFSAANVTVCGGGVA